ncbi:hypothetical protein A3L04_06015 [Thermococcus chitonophagus]|uniref:Uncharacterized protein n=1 Tax=Thermococcus chitonophagus TaxID=54262 RepID=A0A160VUQ8_9EURY|nr:hypothetical protein [Thermococcus chitonophagus]ASJ16654.1 hypothetical protein A3L04_06015 [Thermococcus chitonophagus]CUX77421.1 hypothetical protein CHITON_0642 [Thermococcus chitonophagus]
MRSLKAFLLLLLVVSIVTKPSMGGFEPIKRNNIYLTGLVEVELNVTLVNTGDVPRYIIVNPRYQFEVLRKNESEFLYHTSSGDSIVGTPGQTLLNYVPGFWIYPHEVLRVRFFINETDAFPIDLKNYYQPQCTGYGYIEGDVLKIKIPPTIYTGPICNVMYPQLLNFPHYLDPKALFDIKAFDVVVYNYQGIVKFKVTHNTTLNIPTRVVFAIAPPLLFPGAKVYGYSPAPTMNYTGYIEYLQETFWSTGEINQPSSIDIQNELVIYDISQDLLTSKVKINTAKTVNTKIDYPVWVVWLGDGSSIEISYKFKWGVN